MTHDLLNDDLSVEEAEKLQNKYRLLIYEEAPEDKPYISINEIKTVAGVDVSYFKDDHNEKGVACAVLWDLKSNKMIQRSLAEGTIRFPYKPGFLGFRECNLLAKAISNLKEKPDVIMCDGHGTVHPKKFGEAVQFGVALNIPTMGVAKNPFVGYSNWENMKRIKGEQDAILAEQALMEIIGCAVCLNDGMKPVFISEGYKMTTELAIKIALKTTQNHRQPEPLYLADHYSRENITDQR